MQVQEAYFDEVFETVKEIEACLSKMEKVHDAELQGWKHGLDFVETTVSGLKVSALVDMVATHNLASSRTVGSLHSGMEFS